MYSITTINNLPPEMILQIVSKLPIDDIFNCKLLNKSFYFLIKFNLGIKNLIISDNNIRNNSFYTKKLVDQISFHRFELPGPNSLDNFFLNQKFPGLRFLYINCKHYEILIKDSNSLNSLSRLEHLELIGLDLKYSKLKNFKVNLPFLLTLNITNTFYNELTIDCPQLKNFKLKINSSEINPINFIHNESIKFCELSSYRNFVTSFINLEKLYCANTTELNDNEFLIKLPNLNEILIDSNKKLFNDLIIQNKKQSNRNLKIYFMGVLFNELPDFKWADKISFAIDIELIDFFFRNEDKMNDYIPFCRCIEYSILERYFKEKLHKLFYKFANLGRLKVSRQVIYYDKFIEFLNNYKTINELDLSSSLLEQDFFNQLPYYLTDLEFLYINQEPNISNFDFILCFRSLEVVSIGLEVPLDIVEKAFHKFKRLDQFIFFYLNNLIQVCSSLKKILYIADNKPIEFDDFNSLFKVLRDMKNIAEENMDICN